MLNETIEPNLISLKKGIERTAAACGVWVGVVKKIRKEKKDLDTTDDTTCSFATPKKKKRSKIVTDIDDFDKCVIRRKIYNFYKSERSLPSLKLLKNTLAEDLNFKGSVSSLRTIIKELGFKWKKIENNRKILIERNGIRVKRIDYLKKIKEIRKENKPVVYMDESYVLSTHVTRKG